MTSNLSPAVTPAARSPSPQSTTGTKRNAPNDSPPSDLKRRRTSPSTTAAGQSPDRSRARPSVDEKKRNRRLFGNLLSTLSQTPSSKSRPPRPEIAQREAELASRSEARAASLLSLRKRTQRTVDEKAMRVRHESMRARARFLRTEAEPSIYWRPWQMSEEMEETISVQVQEVEDVVKAEVEAWMEKAERVEENGRSNGMMDVEQSGVDGRKEDDDRNDGMNTSLDEGDRSAILEEQASKLAHEQAESEAARRRDSIEDAADTAVDAGEDTLMY